VIQITDTITIGRPPTEVFAFVADLNNIPKWQSEVVTSKVVTPGPTRVGTRFTEDVKMGPRRVAATCEITEFAPNTVVGFRATSPAMDYSGRFQFEGAAGGTNLIVTATGQLKGWWKLMQPLLKGEFRSGIRKELAALKDILEKNKT
jgi:uncharacterized membrane protein